MYQSIVSTASDWTHEYQTILGYFVILCGTVVVALSSFLKSKGDRAVASRKKEENARSARYYFWFWIVVVVGASLTGLGTWMTKRASDETARNQRQQNEETLRDVREKIQLLLAERNAAKLEDSKKITEEKIHVIETDLAQWAERFATSIPTKRSEFAQRKAEVQKAEAEKANQETQMQIQRSRKAYPVLSFATRFVEESVRAYAIRTGKTNAIKISSIQWPDNFFEKNCESTIQFGKQCSWSFSIAPFRENINLRLNFASYSGEGAGQFILRYHSDGNSFNYDYSPVVPPTDQSLVNGDLDPSNFEGKIRGVLQKILEAQLIQTEP